MGLGRWSRAGARVRDRPLVGLPAGLRRAGGPHRRFPERSALAGRADPEGRPAPAQPATEIEVGEGFHIRVGPRDLIKLPSVPTADVRVTRWLDDRWGVSGRAMVGLGGSVLPESGRYIERSYPIYIQVLVRRRFPVGKTGALLVGFGAGANSYYASSVDSTARAKGGRRTWWYHLLALEALGSWALTDRLDVRVGASALVAFHVHPVALLAWQF